MSAAEGLARGLSAADDDPAGAGAGPGDGARAGAPAAAMARFLRPRSIAIIGAAATPGALGAGVLANLERFGFPGEIYLINPNRTEINGRPCLASADQLPEGVDCAVLAIPGHGVLEAVRACARRGVGGVVVYASGFAEAGGEGLRLQQEMARVAGEAGMVLEGPNCLGYVNYVDSVALTFGPTLPSPVGERRALGIVAQSGSMSGVIRAASAARGLAVSYSVSTGNEAASSIEDYLEFLLDEPHTAVITLFVEQFRQPQRFLGLCRAARARGKTLLLFHVARSAAGRESARTHTGALSGDHEVMRACVTREGVLLAESFEETLDLAELLLRFPGRPRGSLAVLTESGAFKGIAVDYCEWLGLELPPPQGETAAVLDRLAPGLISAANPLDLTGLAVSDPGVFRRAMEPFFADDRYGMLLLNKTGSSSAAMLRAGTAILESLRAAPLPKPVLFTMLGDEVEVAAEIVRGFRDLNIPFYRSPERALRAVARLMQADADAAAQATPTGAEGVAPPAGAARSFHAALPAGPLPEYVAKRVLRSIGIAVPEGDLAVTLDDACAIARRIGYPLALKAQSAVLAHKTEAGAVLLDLADEAALRRGWAALQQRMAALPGVVLDGMLVERMAAKGLELIVGARRDPQWGPVLILGMGGIWAEALRDVRILPADAPVPAMVAALRRLQSAALLNGYRGAPAVDVEACCDVARRVGAWLIAQPDIGEIDLNPVRVHARGKGAVALDALILRR